MQQAELVARFPLTIPMMDLYDREMCYRFPEALPADEARRSGYEVGDIAYWAPRHSFVIFYEQNGEIIGNLQKIGRIHSGVDLFARTGDTDVTLNFSMSNDAQRIIFGKGGRFLPALVLSGTPEFFVPDMAVKGNF